MIIFTKPVCYLLFVYLGFRYRFKYISIIIIDTTCNISLWYFISEYLIQSRMPKTVVEVVTPIDMTKGSGILTDLLAVSSII